MRSRAPIQRIAEAPAFRARSMTPGGWVYSLKRSAQVHPSSVYASRIAPLAAPPARAKSFSLPEPISTMFASIPPADVGGDQPAATRRTGNLTGPSSSSRVAPSFQVTGSVYFSVWTATPSARNAATAQSTALAISGEPVTRPPPSSVTRRRFSSSGEGPKTCGRIFAAASAQDDSVAEQPADVCADVLPRVSDFAGGSCAHKPDAKQQRNNGNETRRKLRRSRPRLSKD